MWKFRTTVTRKTTFTSSGFASRMLCWLYENRFFSYHHHLKLPIPFFAFYYKIIFWRFRPGYQFFSNILLSWSNCFAALSEIFVKLLHSFQNFPSFSFKLILSFTLTLFLFSFGFFCKKINIFLPCCFVYFLFFFVNWYYLIWFDFWYDLILCFHLCSQNLRNFTSNTFKII